MKLTWINHASFLVEHGVTRLLCDPWLEGHVFDNSWALLSPSKFSYSDFETVTHIWFSHEHPDHFFPPNLKQIPPEIRKNITILFQPTKPKDRRLLRFCRNLGFKVVLEAPAEWFALADDFEVFCQPAGRGDSWLAIRAAGKLLLNMNDCIYNAEYQLLPVRQALGHIDALITQFSYASWWGNPSEDNLWRDAATEALSKVRREINVLQPDAVVLSASYVFFCHEENHYMNKHMNRVSHAYQTLLEDAKTRPIVLYPGDEWSPGDPWDSSLAVTRYETDYDAALRDPVREHSAVAPLDQVLKGGNSFIRTLSRTNSRLLLRRVQATTIDLVDHHVSLRLDAGCLKKIRRLEDDEHDIALSSSALLYCLRFPWGGETLMINGRFRTLKKGDRDRFFRWFAIAQANSRATYYDREYYITKIRTKARGLLRSLARGRDSKG